MKQSSGLPAFRIPQKIKGLLRRIRPHGLVLLYHRVAPLEHDPQWLAVAPPRFSEQMEILARDFQPMPLREMLRSALQGRLPRRAVAVTFDDGYADNLQWAKPILERHGVPGTVFVATDPISKPAEFWWDELGGLILETPRLPERLALRNGFTCTFGEDPPARGDGWHLMMPGPDTPRQAAYRELCGLIRPLPADVREAVMHEIAAALGSPRLARENQRAMNADEIRQLAAGGQVEVGAHTVHHPVLSTLDLAAQRTELKESKDRLEQLVGGPVAAFSYPFGKTTDYNRASVAAAREVGFECACSNFQGHVNSRVNPFEVPRYLVRDWSGEEFRREIGEWFA